MGSGVLHSLNLTTSDHDLAQTIENSSLGQWFRPKTKYGGKWAGWQLDATSTSFAKILGVARYARELLGGRVQYRQKANFPVGTFEVMPASNLFPGVEVPVVTDDEVHVGVVKEVRDEGIGALVDISVPEYGNFIANGIVTHNSIYGWRGAQPSNLKKFRDEFGAQVFELTKNHRSTGSIVDFSRKIIDQFPAPMRTSALSSTRHRGSTLLSMSSTTTKQKRRQSQLGSVRFWTKVYLRKR
jgi:DNA helicase-2/ATP-dependent DNA helicase PcrA